eukprot:TRINITY_DN27767_c0_g1_i1.p1 TRINITY_DN27767_c0_g1~~TRINITY_DN27767_c0_g1_i1.p1  ORF type:complete len:352 (-),score=77.93 TRINITY_DN27767_c0_g1_i1:160-1158(-)
MPATPTTALCAAATAFLASLSMHKGWEGTLTPASEVRTAEMRPSSLELSAYGEDYLHTITPPLKKTDEDSGALGAAVVAVLVAGLFWDLIVWRLADGEMLRVPKRSAFDVSGADKEVQTELIAEDLGDVPRGCADWPDSATHDEDALLQELGTLAEQPWVVEDPDMYAIFETPEEESAYHRKRSAVLHKFVDGFFALQTAGARLMDDFDRMCADNQAQIGEAAVWLEQFQQRTLEEEIAQAAAIPVDACRRCGLACSADGHGACSKQHRCAAEPPLSCHDDCKAEGGVVLGSSGIEVIEDMICPTCGPTVPQLLMPSLAESHSEDSTDDARD